MQITDMLNQYNRNTATGATATSPQQGVQQLVSAVKGMTVGNVFEGTVSSMKHGNVILALGNGQTVNARVAGNVKLTQGQSMFFQVKSNDGSTVEIRPFTNGNLNNPTLLKALDAAGIVADAKSIEMVNTMMEEQLPIDRASIQAMARMLSGFGDADIKTMVQMSKLELPLTMENINQFTNYRNDQAAITRQFTDVLSSLGEVYQNPALSTEQSLQMAEHIWEALRPDDAFLQESAAVADDGRWSPVNPMPDGAAVQQAGEQGAVLDGQEAAAEKADAGAVVAETVTEAAGEDADVILQVNEQAGQKTYAAHTLGAALQEQGMRELARQLGQFPELSEQAKLMHDGKLNPDQSVREFMDMLHEALRQTENPKEAAVKNLLSGKAYRSLLQDSMEQQWLLRPQDVKADTVKKLYERLEGQMQRMQQVITQSGQEHTTLARAVSDLRGNVEFMNDISHMYHFVQLPLKMTGQNAHGDLYVYTNKKNLEEQEGDLTAFLHLDMDHLGATDVSVRMRGQKVHTDFFLEDDRSFALIMEHSKELALRLEEKGYQCSVQVENQKKEMNLVEDFMKKDAPPAGILHRYSFDMRA